MPITIPDDRELRSRALAAGFAAVEEYLLDLVARDARRDGVRPAVSEAGREGRSGDDREGVTDEEWIDDFRSLLRSLPSHNTRFDDRRESIYPVR